MLLLFGDDLKVDLEVEDEGEAVEVVGEIEVDLSGGWGGVTTRCGGVTTRATAGNVLTGFTKVSS